MASPKSSSSATPQYLGHAVVFAWPGQGHLNPLFHFAQLLASRGFFITFVHTDHNLRRISSSVAPPTHNFQLVSIPDGLPPDHPRDVLALISATDNLSQTLPAAFEKLVDGLVHQEHNPVTCIVADYFMMFTQDVANKFALPRVTVYVQCASSFACHVAVNKGFKPSQGQTVIDCIPGVPPLKLDEMISFLQSYDPSDPIVDYMLRPFKRLDEPAWILLNTFDELEHDAIQGLQDPRQIHCVGPLLPLSFLDDRWSTASDPGTSLWAEEYDCVRWLDSQAPSSVLYVSFGSLVTLSAEQTEEVALGLESSQQPFLWVIRQGSLEAGLPEGFKARVENRACFVLWAPQLKVLTHPSIGGFLMHSGWNSTLESISAGVPMLAWAEFADQKLNCRCMVDKWKVGLLLSSSDKTGGLVSREEVEEKVRMLMVERSAGLRTRCDVMRHAAREAAASARHILLDKIVADLLKKKPTMLEEAKGIDAS